MPANMRGRLSIVITRLNAIAPAICMPIETVTRLLVTGERYTSPAVMLR